MVQGSDKARVCFLLLGGLVKAGLCVEVDHTLQVTPIQQCVLQRVDYWSPVSESPGCLLKPQVWTRSLLGGGGQ